MSLLYCLLDLERAFAMLVCLQHLTKYWRRRKVILVVVVTPLLAIIHDQVCKAR